MMPTSDSRNTILANGWTKLLQDMEPENDVKGFETSDSHVIIKRAGDDVTENDEQWLDRLSNANPRSDSRKCSAGQGRRRQCH
jgi:hypothetical protein